MNQSDDFSLETAACLWDFASEWIVRHIDWSDPARPTIRAQPLPKGGKLLMELVLLPATSPTSETPISEGI